MHTPHMTFQITQLVTRFSTQATYKRFFTSMYTYMPLKCVVIEESLVTKFTNKCFSFIMNTHMSSHRVDMREGPATVLTFVIVSSRVH